MIGKEREREGGGRGGSESGTRIGDKSVELRANKRRDSGLVE